MTEPVSTSLGEKMASSVVGAGGLTLPLWIQYFQQYSQVVITSIYLIVAFVTFYRTVIKPMKKKKK